MAELDRGGYARGEEHERHGDDEQSTLTRRALGGREHSTSGSEQPPHRLLLDSRSKRLRGQRRGRPGGVRRTIYRPGELVQCDLWEPREPIPVGHGQLRRGWVVTAEVC